MMMMLLLMVMVMLLLLLQLLVMMVMMMAMVKVERLIAMMMGLRPRYFYGGLKTSLCLRGRRCG